MKTERLNRAIGKIDDALVVGALQEIPRAKKVRKWVTRGTLAACLALLVCAGLGLHALAGNVPIGNFTMDVNPSVEYTVAKNGVVKEVSFLNDDAKTALHDVALRKQSVEVALKRTVEAYQSCGYMQSSESVFLISFDAKRNGDPEVIHALSDTIQTALEETDAVGKLVFHVASDDDRAAQIAKDFNLTQGKADWVLTAAKKTDISPAELAQMPLSELFTFQEEHYTPLVKARYIGLEKAKQIALQDAGPAMRVTFTEAKLVDGGIKTPHYRIAFENKQTRWFYRIDATSGGILERTKEYIGGNPLISMEEAKEIAIRDTGLGTEQKFIFTQAVLLRNSGKPIYVLAFHTSDEYYFFAYTIDARTGEILARRYIGMEKAKQIALQDANPDVRVTFTETTLVDGGIKSPYYRIAFESTQTRWSYRIDATSGAIRDKSQEPIGGNPLLSLEQAKEIAIRDAGLGAEQKLIFTQEDLIRNSGKPIYVLAFHTSDKYYFFTYTIDARTGEILARRYIGMEKAKQIALQDAGVGSEAAFTEEKLVDGGIKTPYYRLVFEVAQTRWTYRIDATSGGILERTKEEIGGNTMLTLEEAKEIAIRDTGLSADQKFIFTQEVLSRNSGKPIYLLAFHTSDEYYFFTYTIDARTGEILARRYIGLEKAKQIALQDAGPATRVTFVETKLVDGGIKTPYYRIVFENAQTRWTYRIDATSGGILEKTKEDLGGPEYISLEKAKAIALDDAGVQNKVLFSEAELVDGGTKTPYYRIVFENAQTRWTYRIDAVTGGILEKIKEALGGPEYISLEKAKGIALDDAGVQNKVLFSEAELVDGGIKTPYYRLSFEAMQYRWFYRIDAVTGNILEKKQDPIKDTTKDVAPQSASAFRLE